MAVDGGGNVYVADTGNHTIRRITPGGVVTTLAGLVKTEGSADGSGGAGRFNHPAGVAADGFGNVYVADTGNHTVRRITPEGAVTTLAGLAGSSGSADGAGAAARFSELAGVAVDVFGNVYAADAGNNTVRKITPGGEVTTLAGLAGVGGSADGLGGSARFLSPRGVAADGSGNVYVTDTGNSTIRKITPAGEVTTLAGAAGSYGSADGMGSAAQFRSPHGVTVDGGGNVYVADFGNHTIRKITRTGLVTTLGGLAGQADYVDGVGGQSRFFHPTNLAIDGSGTLYLADTIHHTIRKITSGAVVSTLSGNVVSSGSAMLSPHGGLAIDNSSNVYLADWTWHAIRKINPAGVVATLAGLPGASGSANGTGGAARFYEPRDVAVDGFGNVYVAEIFSSHTIRKIAPGGVVTTLAGLAGTPGSANGTGTNARFNYPHGITADENGSVYVTEFQSHSVRKISPGGQVTTFAGSAEFGAIPGYRGGTGDQVRFSYPASVVVDAGGNVYVADLGNDSIRKISPGGEVTPSPFNYGDLVGLAMDGSGNVYVTDDYRHTVVKITPSGEMITLAGGGDFQDSGSADGTGHDARFYYPAGVAVDGSGNVYVADSFNDTVRKITAGGEVTTLAGLAGAAGGADGMGAAARFRYPQGVAVDGGGNVYVADTGNHTIRKITPGGAVTTLAGLAGEPGVAEGAGGNARFDAPYGVVADRDGNVYVADTGNHSIRKITPAGAVTTLAGTAALYGSADGSGSAAQFWYPGGVALDGGGNLYVGDSGNHTIRKVSPEGLVTTLAGKAPSVGNRDGPGAEARFYDPSGLAADGGGNVYVADLSNHTIRKIAPGGTVTTLAGRAGAAGIADGTGTAARFFYPWDVAVDSGGSVYVADSGNNTIRKITPAGTVITIGGRAGVHGTWDSPGGARFSSPRNVAVDGSGRVYVTDQSGVISRGTPVPPGLEGWRKLHFGAAADNNGDAASTFDYDKDGLANLLEYALGLDPKAPSRAPLGLAGGEAGLLDFSYSRSAAAFNAGALFSVEWSDNPAGPWSAQEVTESILPEGALLQRVKAAVPAGGSGRRFVRLRVAVP